MNGSSWLVCSFSLFQLTKVLISMLFRKTYTPAPFATTFSSTRTPLDWSKIPTRFVDLVTILRTLAAKGVPMPLNSAVKQGIRTLYPNFYDSSPGTSTSFRKFAREAVAAGVIERGGEEGQAWVKLKPEFL